MAKIGYWTLVDRKPSIQVTPIQGAIFMMPTLLFQAVEGDSRYDLAIVKSYQECELLKRD